MNIFKLFILLGICLIQSCIQYNCDEETKEIEKMRFDMKIDRKYIQSHRGHLLGYDSLGNIQEFEYHGFLYLDELAKPGDRFLKDMGSMIFTLQKKNIIYKFEWDCISTGALISTDTIKAD